MVQAVAVGAMVAGVKVGAVAEAVEMVAVWVVARAAVRAVAARVEVKEVVMGAATEAGRAAEMVAVAQAAATEAGAVASMAGAPAEAAKVEATVRVGALVEPMVVLVGGAGVGLVEGVTGCEAQQIPGRRTYTARLPMQCSSCAEVPGRCIRHAVAPALPALDTQLYAGLRPRCTCPSTMSHRVPPTRSDPNFWVGRSALDYSSN